jgi:hypothetical protein
MIPSIHLHLKYYKGNIIVQPMCVKNYTNEVTVGTIPLVWYKNLATGELLVATKSSFLNHFKVYTGKVYCDNFPEYEYKYAYNYEKLLLISSNYYTGMNEFLLANPKASSCAQIVETKRLRIQEESNPFV